MFHPSCFWRSNVTKKSLSTKIEVEVCEDCFKVGDKEYKINEAIFIRVKKMYIDSKKFDMMELKIKRDFDLMGDVYEKFRGNEDVFLTNQQIYDLFEIFWEKNCSGLQAEEHPKLYIVGAQPGAGKTGLVSLISETYKVKAFIGDIFRGSHPNAVKFLNSEEYSSFTGPLDGVMNKLCIARCIDRKISLVQETTMAHLDSILENINAAITNNYEINLCQLAVSKYDSFLGIYSRAANFVKFGSALRLVNPKFHDIAYEGVLKIFDYPDIITKLNSVVIYNRRLEMICGLNGQKLSDNTKLKIDFIKKLIERERTRVHTNEEMAELEEQKFIVLDCIDKGLIPVKRETFLKELESRKGFARDL